MVVQMYVDLGDKCRWKDQNSHVSTSWTEVNVVGVITFLILSKNKESVNKASK